MDEKKVAALLRRLRITPNLNGYYYIKEAVIGYKQGIQVTNELYPDVAKKFNSTPSKVERGIRHSIEKACGFGYNKKLLEEIFGEDFTTPTNAEFIATLHEYLLDQE